MTRVVISQPMYFPWAGFMAQMALADVYIWLDDVQYSKGSFTNRIQVKAGGERRWMSIPLAGKGSHQLIRDLQPSDEAWPASHRSILKQALSEYPYKATSLSLFEQTMALEAPLCDMLIASAETQARHLGVLPRRIYRSSSMSLNSSSSKRVLELVLAVEGKDYVTGHGALSYLDHEAFNSAHVSVSYMQYAPLPWPQAQGDFIPYVTGLDLIASLSAETAKDHLRPATVDWREFKASKEQQT